MRLLLLLKSLNKYIKLVCQEELVRPNRFLDCQKTLFYVVSFSVNTVNIVCCYLGIIINMCSIASSLAGGGGHAYTSSKHALAGFTKQLALDYAEAGIQVFGIAPGAVKTGMTATDFELGGLADWVASETPIKRWIEPEEVAEISLFLASGKASAMQGQILTIDGGWSLK